MGACTHVVCPIAASIKQVQPPCVEVVFEPQVWRSVAELHATDVSEFTSLTDIPRCYSCQQNS